MAGAAFVVLASRLALFLTLMHFIFTVSEAHGKLIATIYLIGMISEMVLKNLLDKEGSNEQNGKNN